MVEHAGGWFRSARCKSSSKGAFPRRRVGRCILRWDPTAINSAKVGTALGTHRRDG